LECPRHSHSSRDGDADNLIIMTTITPSTLSTSDLAARAN